MLCIHVACKSDQLYLIAVVYQQLSVGVFTCHDCVDEVYTDSAVWHRVDHETIFFNSNDISKTNASSFLTQVRYSLCMKTFASAT